MSTWRLRCQVVIDQNLPGRIKSETPCWPSQEELVHSVLCSPKVSALALSPLLGSEGCISGVHGGYGALPGYIWAAVNSVTCCIICS
jgi:hypothetical protein